MCPLLSPGGEGRCTPPRAHRWHSIARPVNRGKTRTGLTFPQHGDHPVKADALRAHLLRRGALQVCGEALFDTAHCMHLYRSRLAPATAAGRRELGPRRAVGYDETGRNREAPRP